MQRIALFMHTQNQSTHKIGQMTTLVQGAHRSVQAEMCKMSNRTMIKNISFE